MESKERIIIALDFDNYDIAESMVKKLKEAVFFKVGLQSFIKFGDKILSLLNEENKKIFLDLKFFDIPNTVFGAIKSSLKFNPYFLTIHLLGGKDMIKYAIDSADEKTNIVGVSVLTSLDNNDLSEMGFSKSTDEEVLNLIELGINCGLKNFVCSGKEVKRIREEFGNEIKLITPGIRPLWAKKGDQKRILTPSKAIEIGSDYLVIGRPITSSSNPVKSFSDILKEIN